MKRGIAVLSMVGIALGAFALGRAGAQEGPDSGKSAEAEMAAWLELGKTGPEHGGADEERGQLDGRDEDLDAARRRAHRNQGQGGLHGAARGSLPAAGIRRRVHGPALPRDRLHRLQQRHEEVRGRVDRQRQHRADAHDRHGDGAGQGVDVHGHLHGARRQGDAACAPSCGRWAATGWSSSRSAPRAARSRGSAGRGRTRGRSSASRLRSGGARGLAKILAAE